MENIKKALAAKESVEDEIIKRPGVTGVAVGYKYVKGKRTSQIAVQVFVRKKKKEIPTEQRVPEEVEGVPTDVIERVFKPHPLSRKVTEIRPMADTGTYNPVKGGVSIGPCRAVGGYVFAGTLGAPVKDNSTGNTLLLSNFHVMCVDTGWSVGDQMCQPSRVDTGTCPASVVGTLLRAQLTASVDAAVCTLSGRGSACEIVDIGQINGTNTAALDMNVRKRGRTTGLTYGKVDSISLSVSIDYEDGLGVKVLTNQIGITPDTTKNPMFGDHGDSGSVVVDDNRKVVGLYFAGSDDGYGVANPIAAVLSALDISMCQPLVKSIVKDFKDRKDTKIEKEGKREIKEFKVEKYELKERIKDRKPEKFEYEQLKTINEYDPKISEVDPYQPVNPIDPGSPFGPGLPGGGGPVGRLEERLAQLEALVGQLTTFISAELRPDLAQGALSNEPDVGKSSQQLRQQAIDAMQAKAAADNKCCGQ